MRNKDSAGEYSSQQGASPSVSVGNVDAVTNEASTHRRVPVVGSVKGKGPAVCKLMLRQATVASKTRNCNSKTNQSTNSHCPTNYFVYVNCTCRF